MNQTSLKTKMGVSSGFKSKMPMGSLRPIARTRPCYSGLVRVQPRPRLVTRATATVVTRPPLGPNPVLDEDVQLDWMSDFYENYEYVRKLNAGSFGKVWLARDLATGESVAVKEIAKTRGRLTPARVRQKVEQEVKVLEYLSSCPLVVGLKGLFMEEMEYLIVMELCEGEDMKLHVAENGPVSEQLTAAIAFEILKVVRACHDKDFVHGDIKTANFMLKSGHCNPFADSNIPVLQPGWLKAIDFGCAQVYKGDMRLRSRVGTPVYMAPEVFQRNFGKECDMWSLGVLLFHLMSGSFPFWKTSGEALMCSVSEVSEAVQTKPVDFTSTTEWRESSSECREFISGLLTKDYSERMTLSEAERHPFLTRNLILGNEGCTMLQSNNIIQYDTSLIPIQT